MVDLYVTSGLIACILQCIQIKKKNLYVVQV